MLKRKLEETVGEGEGTDNASTSNGPLESEDSNCSAGSTDALAPEVASGPSPPKRMKKKVNFKGVTVYYFPRRQGFTCVPSEGGSTLGMTEKHTFTRDFSLSDYTKEQKRIHRAILAEQRRQGKMFPSPLLSTPLQTGDNDDDVSSGSESDSEYDDYYFLQPLPIRQRRVMLRTSGVKKIDNEEKEECRDIRVSRNVCGCDCKVFCDPATCSCSIAGIQCQVDRLSFPCGCTKDGCGNPAGRIEFNPIRVRTHFIHTLMRLELEKKDPECPEGNPGAATMSSSFSPSSSTSGEIDVVGANGEEGEAIVAETTDNSSNDSCSGASTDASSSGKFVLKSRLKSKKTEAIDLNMFNSNEKGSCRDCQNTDMCNVMMHDVKFSMVSQQQRQQQQQQQRVITAALGPQPGYPGSPLPQQLQHHHHHLNLSPGISLLHPPPPPPPQQQSQQHMLLFNDGEEEVYHAENTTSMYFDNDDSSYSEMSDTSPEGLESRPFATLGQPNFAHKFHVTPSQMFSASVNSSNISPVDNHAPRMTNQTSLLNPSCIQSLQVNGGCGANPSTSCNSMGSDHQQSCGLLSQSHVQQTCTTAVTGQSLLRPPYMHGSTSSPGSCVGSQTPISSSGFAVPNSPLARPQMSSPESLNMPDSNMMLPGSLPGFHGKYPHSQVMDTSILSTPSYKVVPPLLTSQNYVSGVSSIPNTDYLSQPRHVSNFTPPNSSEYGISTTSSANSGSKSSFEPLQTPQLSSCWSTSLASPTLRECFGLGPSSSTAPSSSTTDHQTPAVGASCNPSSYQPETDLCAVTANPASPNSPTTTYATMTTTTRDRLAAHCPGISSHMDSRQELSPTSSQKDSTPSFSDYRMASESSETTSLVGSSQNLLYSSPYPETNSIDACVDTTTSAVEMKTPDVEGHGIHSDWTQASSSSSSKPISSSVSPSPFTSSLSKPSPVNSDEISSTCLPSSSVILSSVGLLSSTTATQSSSEASHCPTATITSVSTPVQLVASNKADPLKDFPDSLTRTAPSTTADDAKSNEAVAKVTSKSTSSSLEAEQLRNERSHNNMANNGQAPQDISSKWNGSEVNVKDVQCEKLSSQMPLDSYDHGRNSESCVTDSETSAVQSATSSTASSSSSSPTTLEEEKEQTVNQNFGEIIKESIVEMVVV